MTRTPLKRYTPLVARTELRRTPLSRGLPPERRAAIRRVSATYFPLLVLLAGSSVLIPTFSLNVSVTNCCSVLPALIAATLTARWSVVGTSVLRGDILTSVSGFFAMRGNVCDMISILQRL